MSSFRLKDYWGKESGFTYVFQNVTLEREHNQRIKKMAVRDQLTGLAHRAGMYEYVDQQMSDEYASFMFIDVDNFKLVNDQFGHGMGDQFLKDLAKVLSAMDERAFTTRLGGDEFFVILPHVLKLEVLREKASSLLAQVKTLQGYPRELFTLVSLSIGILPNYPLSNDIDQTVQRADALMYAAKKAGKNQFFMELAQ